MKILTTNFLTCAVKACKTSPTSFPLNPQGVTLSSTPVDFSPDFILNILPRVHYDALVLITDSLSLGALLPAREVFEGLVERLTTSDDTGVEQSGGQEDEEEVLKKLHRLLLETNIMDGKLVCGNCGFEYPVKEGVGNFLLPSHLV
jgi:multifunctional methyltransferase subunit TRM112